MGAKAFWLRYAAFFGHKCKASHQPNEQKDFKQWSDFLVDLRHFAAMLAC